MSEVCMFEILALPEDDLKRVLPKASSRSLAKLLAAYPRSVGQTFLTILKKSMSPVTIEFLREEMNCSKLPTYPEIRLAEQELLKIIHDERLVHSGASAQLATQLAQ